jgi:hypothetical protein
VVARMSFARQGTASSYRAALSGPFLAIFLTGCLGVPDVDQPGAVTSTSPARAAVIAEMRAKAAAGDQMPYPDAFQINQTVRLAAREEPLSLGTVQEIETELAQIADRRARSTDAAEIAALDARARQLRKLALAAAGGAESLR